MVVPSEEPLVELSSFAASLDVSVTLKADQTAEKLSSKNAHHQVKQLLSKKWLRLSKNTMEAHHQARATHPQEDIHLMASQVTHLQVAIHPQDNQVTHLQVAINPICSQVTQVVRHMLSKKWLRLWKNTMEAHQATHLQEDMILMASQATHLQEAIHLQANQDTHHQVVTLHLQATIEK